MIIELILRFSVHEFRIAPISLPLENGQSRPLGSISEKGMLALEFEPDSLRRKFFPSENLVSRVLGWNSRAHTVNSLLRRRCVPRKGARWTGLVAPGEELTTQDLSSDPCSQVLLSERRTRNTGALHRTSGPRCAPAGH